MKIPSLLILVLTLLLLLPGKGGYAHQETKEDLVTTIYLPYADKTLIYSELGQLALNPSPGVRHLSMQIRAEYKGRNRIKPELVELLLGTFGKWSPSDEHKPRLLIIADGKTFDAQRPDKPTYYSFSLHVEMMDFSLPREEFLRVAGARTVTLQLDGVNLDLTDAQRKRLRAFAKELR